MPKLPTLQSLRAIAALLVVFDHTADLVAGHGLAAEPLHSFALFAGAQGVALFFLLSGFIMVYTTAGTATQPPVARALNFATKRILRIVPLYWLLTAVIAVPVFFISLHRPVHITLTADLCSFLFIPHADFAGHMTPVLPVGWTLNYEMAFYALFTAILMLPRRAQVVALVSTLGIAVSIGARCFPVYTGDNPHTPLAFMTHPILLLFGLGAVLGSMKLRWSAVSLPVPALPSVLLLLILNGAIFLHAGAHQPTLPYLALYWTIDLLAVAVCAFGFRTYLPTFEHKIEAAGDASYSLYLVHLLPVLICWVIYQRLTTPHPVAFIVVASASAIAAGQLCYRYVEQPLTRSLSARLAPRKHSPMHAEAILQNANSEASLA